MASDSSANHREHRHGRVLGLVPVRHAHVEEIDCTPIVEDDPVEPQTFVGRLTGAFDGCRLFVTRLVSIQTTITTTTVAIVASSSASNTGLMASFDRTSRAVHFATTQTTTRTEVRTAVRKLAAARVIHGADLRRGPYPAKPDPKQSAIESFKRARRRRSPVPRKR